ncbi:MAG: hypothetical protein NUV76_11625, partial [Candidatus Kuenenia sp.]|nr:hypothetical protein [Candidatus Kuenenia sp.]
MGRQEKTPAATEYKKVAVSYRGHDKNYRVKVEGLREHSRFFVTRHFSRMKREYRTAEQGISNYEVFL